MPPPVPPTRIGSALELALAWDGMPYCVEAFVASLAGPAMLYARGGRSVGAALLAWAAALLPSLALELLAYRFRTTRDR
jgi:hypothetical protein